jgi:hypothetical protein
MLFSIQFNLNLGIFKYLQQTLQDQRIEDLAVFALILVHVSQLLPGIIKNTSNVILSDLQCLQASLVQHV